MIQEQTNGLPNSASPQAEAAYPDTTSGFGIEAHAIARERAAFDAGRRSRDAEIAEQEKRFADLELLVAERSASSSLVATREAIERAIHSEAVAPYLVTIAEAIGSQEHYNEFLSKIADAVLGVVREVGAVEAEQREKDAVIVADLVDPDPCEWDHNHSCQAHGHFYIPQGELCPNEAGRQFVAAAAIRGGEKND